MDSETLKKSTTTDGQPPEPGFENAGAPKPINPETGQHRAYWVLKPEERAKGWVRPFRNSYKHVGLSAPSHLRDLTAEEKERFAAYDYVKYEEIDSTTGMFWTQGRLDQVGNGCGAVTTMGTALSETYAVDPTYYGSTFCTQCGTHLPVAEFIWTADSQVVGS